MLLLLLLLGPFTPSHHWRIKRFVVYVYDIGNLVYICTGLAILTDYIEDEFLYKYMLTVDL